MLNQSAAIATVPVKDMAASRRFYEETLELPAIQDTMGAITYQSGNSQLMLYESQYAGTNKATTVTWRVGDEVDAIVQRLARKNVGFEHYDLPDVRREGDIHVVGNLRMAWFRDPSGNILALVGDGR